MLQIGECDVLLELQLVEAGMVRTMKLLYFHTESIKTATTTLNKRTCVTFSRRQQENAK